MPSKLFWLFLVLLLSISTFGLWMCCMLLISTTSTVIGIAIMVYCGQELKLQVNFDPYAKSNTRNSFPFMGIHKVYVQMNNPPKIPKSDKRLTGSNEIDAPLKEMLFYIKRDFINSWYKDLSSNDNFINSFNEMCKHLINNFSNSSKEVNWISFITHKVVEDFTTHLRLYRHAEMKFRKHQREKTYPSIESAFFDLEATLDKNICRENVSTSSKNEKEYLKTICDVILYLLLPHEDFNNSILKHCLREVLISSVFNPMLSQFSDPDVINQNLISLCKDHPLSSKSLLGVLRRTDSKEELIAFQQISKHEIKVQNAKDTGDKDEMKKYIKSISFVQNIANQRYERLCGLLRHGDSDSTEFYLNIGLYDMTDSATPAKQRKLVSLPFNVILNDNIALHYFTQYLANMDADNYVFFYHNIEGFRTTVEMLVAATSQSSETTNEQLRNLALQLFDSYLSSNATTKLNLDESLLRKLLTRIKTENITIHCFDEVQEKVYDLLENEFYLTGFKDTKQYVKLLAELDLLNDMSPNGDLDSLSSSKSEEEEKFNCDTVIPTDEEMLNELLNTEISVSDFEFPDMSSGPLHGGTKEIGLLFAEVHSTGITHHAGRTFAVYAISVSHHRIEGPEEKWFVIRRYSEFYDFHEALIQRFPMLAYFNFPSKKPFNNLTRQLMEKRRHMLNEFMQFLLAPDILSTCDGLNGMIYNFLQPNVCEKGKKSFVRTVGTTFVNPIKSSVKSVGNIVRLVPDTFFELKDGIIKAFSKGSEPDRTQSMSDAKPLPSNSTEKTDDIPFRIILLLMDEVFNLRNKDLWFRRRIMALLRQIIKTMQGGAINRKIKEYVQGLTSATQIAELLKILSKSIWPDGVLADETPERDNNTKMRTRIVAKMLLFCAIPDELKHIIGYETSFKGAMLIFNMFQHPSLNRRLLFILFESLLIVLFPKNKMQELFQNLHAALPSQSSMRSTSNDSSTDDSYTVKVQSETEISNDTKEANAKENNVKENKVKENNAKENNAKGTNATEVRKEVVKENTAIRTPNESRSKFNLQCLSQQSFPSPKPGKKRKKSIETAIFYTDIKDEEDTIILPLGR